MTRSGITPVTAFADRKKRLAEGKVAVFAEHDVDQGAITIDRTVEILPAAVHSNIGLIDIPATTDLALSASAKFLRQRERQLGLPVAHRLVAGKLERWSDFRRRAADDPLQEGNASPVIVGEALDEIAGEMEKRSDCFDPELPKTFRFLVEAVRDPQGATKVIVYGAVRSMENLVIFLGQRILYQDSLIRTHAPSRAVRST